MAKPKIKQVGRAEAVKFMTGLTIPDMREAATHSCKASVVDMVGFVRKVDPSLSLSNATSLAKGVHAYLNETE